MTDTPSAVNSRYTAALLRQSPARRIEMACEMFGSAKALALAGLRLHSAGPSDSDVRSALFIRLYGGDLSPESRARAEAHLRAA